MIHTLVQAYGKHCKVVIDVATSTITITFTDGIPSLLPQLYDAINQIIHAHLGTIYKAASTHEQMEVYTYEELSRFTYELVITREE